jgi:hypothetical protein
MVFLWRDLYELNSQEQSIIKVKGDGSILLTWKMRIDRIEKCRE